MKLEVFCGFLMLAKLIPVSLMRNRPEERLVPIYDFNFTCTTVDYLQFSMQNPDQRPHPGNMYSSDSVAIPLPNTGRTPPWNRISVSNLRRSVGMAAGLHWGSGTPSNSLSISRTAPFNISVRTRIYSKRFYKCKYCGFRIASLANISLIAQLFGQDLPIPSVMVIHPPLTSVTVQHTNEIEQTPDSLAQRNNLLCGMCEEQIGKCFVVAAADLEIWVLHLPCVKLEPLSIAVSSGVVCLVLCWRDIRKRFTFTCYMSDKLIVPPKASTSSSSNPYENPATETFIPFTHYTLAILPKEWAV
ncbi:hypothetical protein C5167_018527 [Papaver somniferum]|uniref:Yippee domain-containing protein n=1 Tax=Papaver somniferum TaxID=3469 RepID=A0A4Y7IRP6_PAPSO|nr:hypothetical protein C5167_018527 [Papaver somniferum]